MCRLRGACGAPTCCPLPINKGQAAAAALPVPQPALLPALPPSADVLGTTLQLSHDQYGNYVVQVRGHGRHLVQLFKESGRRGGW